METVSEEDAKCLVVKLARARVPRVLILAVVLVLFNPLLTHDEDSVFISD
jgi:hypothetical protein